MYYRVCCNVFNYIHVYCDVIVDVWCELIPDDGIPLKVYLQMKFGDDSYYSEQSQLVQHGKRVVSII